jgi:hypothetical protein
MPSEAVDLWSLLNRIQERARRLEEEAAALRADVEQLKHTLEHDHRRSTEPQSSQPSSRTVTPLAE